MPKNVAPSEPATSNDAISPPSTAERDTDNRADKTPPATTRGILRHDREIQRAESANRRRLGRGADTEQNHHEHDDRKHAEAAPRDADSSFKISNCSPSMRQSSRSAGARRPPPIPKTKGRNAPELCPPPWRLSTPSTTLISCGGASAGRGASVDLQWSPPNRVPVASLPACPVLAASLQRGQAPAFYPAVQALPPAVAPPAVAQKPYAFVAAGAL